MPAWTYPLSPEILSDNAGYIKLVNRDNLLDKSYIPHDLETINVKCDGAIRGGQMRKEALKALNDMFAAAQEAGYTLYAKSVYRSYTTQNTMYHGRVDRLGRDDGVVAYPGSSDHQTGLGIDILNYAWIQKEGMTTAFAQTAEAQWMDAHCHEFGFILRYMEDKEDVTGIIFEPWHFRYVGIEAATYIMENHLALEEFDAEWKQYITDWEAQGGDFKQLLLLRAQPDPVLVLTTTNDGEEEVSLFYN